MARSGFGPANRRIASNDSQNVINRKWVRSPSVRRRTITPWLPGVSRYSFSPDSFSTSKYASALDDGVTPCHVLAITSALPCGIGVGRKNPSPAMDGARLSERAADDDRASLDDDAGHVPADAIPEVAIRGGTEDHEVRKFSRLQATDLVCESDRVRRVNRRGDDRLCRQQAIVVACERDRELRRLAPTVRVEVCPAGDGDARRNQPPTVREWKTGGQRRRREQDTDDRRPGERVDSLRG